MSGSLSTINVYYDTILRRPASPEEAASWANTVDSGAISVDQARAAIIASPEAAADVNPIVRLYQAAFGRVPDAVGFTSWVQQLDAASTAGAAAYNAELSSIANQFTQSAEFAAHYGNTAVNAAYITALYLNVLGRAPDSAGFAYWLSSGLTADQILLDFSQSPEFVAGSAAGVNSFLNSAGLQTESYTGPLPSPGAVGQTFTLTTGTDVLTGTPANDTFIGTIAGVNGAASTLNPGDNLNGEGGVNSLQIVQTIDSGGVNDLTGVTLNNVQTVSLQNASVAGTANVDLTLYPSVTQAIALNTSGGGVDHITGLAAGAQVIASGAGTGSGTVAGTTTVDFDYTTATSAVSVGVDSGANGVIFNNKDAAGTSVGTETAATISSTGAANGTAAKPDTFTLTNGFGTLTALTVNAATNLVADLTNADYAATAALTVSGAATNVNLTGLAGGVAAPTTFKTINASGLSAGGLTTKADATVLTSFTGGAGNDTLTLVDALGAGSIINLGAGNNTLLGTTAVTTSSGTTVNGGGTGGTNTVSSGLIDSSNATQFTNFQDLSLDSAGGSNFNVSLVNGITGLSVDTASAGALYTHVTTSQGLTDNFVGDNSAAVNTLNFSGLSGTGNAYTIAFNGAAQTAVPVATNVQLGEIDAAGINNFTIASGGGGNTWNSLVLGGDASANTVAITGGQNLDLTFDPLHTFGSTAGTHTGVSSIDGSAATGNLNIDLTNLLAPQVATAGLTVKGGTGADTFTTNSYATTLTGGGGADTYNVAATQLAAVDSTTFTTITDAITGDKIAFLQPAAPADDLGFTSAALTVSVTNLGAAVTSALADLATANPTLVPGKSAEGWFHFGSDTYVLQDNGGAAAGSVLVDLHNTPTLSLATAAYSTATSTLTLA